MRVGLMLAALSVVSSAQSKPDFSGDRMLNVSASTLSPAQAGVRSGRVRIQHDDPKLHIQLTLLTADGPIETTVDRVTDGREVTAGQGRFVSSAAWNGNALVLSTRTEGSGCTGSLRIQYELQDGGRRLVATERIRGCGRDQDNVWVFE
jgi:hypothetical protein